jgi:hypothetical protein
LEFDQRAEELLVICPNTYYWGWSSGLSVIEVKFHVCAGRFTAANPWTARETKGVWKSVMITRIKNDNENKE